MITAPMTDSYPNSDMAPKYITIAGEEEEANEHAQLKGALLGVVGSLQFLNL